MLVSFCPSLLKRRFKNCAVRFCKTILVPVFVYTMTGGCLPYNQTGNAVGLIYISGNREISHIPG